MVNDALSAEQQIAGINRAYPRFTLLDSTPWMLLWRGHLMPYCQAYEVQLLYCALSFPFANISANVVHVEVIDPVVTRRISQPTVAIPHIYPNAIMPTRPRLCLHRHDEWSPTMSIADTIVPWTVEWLAAYEGWRATGEWRAGGHNTERNDSTDQHR
jgi:hypothetical protein